MHNPADNSGPARAAAPSPTATAVLPLRLPHGSNRSTV